MKFISKYLATLVVAITFWGCARQPSQSANTVISMQKTACYGACPVYSVEIFDDMKITYLGGENVPVEGEQTGEISRQQLDELIEAFTDSNFFDYESDYMGHVTDLPTTYIQFTYEGRSKKVRDYYGAPQSLKDLENKVEELVRNIFWKEN
jgi:hypothetical protein